MLATVAWTTILCWIVAIPLLVSPHGKETFRAPKDLLFAGEGIVLAGLAVIAAINFRFTGSRAALGRHPVVVASAVVFLWTAVTSLTSTNRALSAAALLWVMAAVAIALGITAFAHATSITALYWALIPAVANAILFLLQRFQIWSPIRFDPTTPQHLQFTALIGNPDDVGSFLVGPMVITLALAAGDPARRRFWIPAAIVLAAALLTGPITSLVASVVGAIVLAFVCSRRIGTITVIALAVLIPAFVFAYSPLRLRVRQIVASARAGDFANATSGRVTPFSAALLMFRDHPLLGVGPHCFAWQYFPYKLEAERRNPKLVDAYVHRFNFGEVHNDHLQTLAETGIPGYALFLAAIWILARRSWRTARDENGTPERELARIACLPLAASLFVLCIAHFPLHLASATSMYLYLGLLCFGWSKPLVVTVERGRVSSLMQLARFAGSVAVIVTATYALYRACYTPYVCNQRKREMELSTMRTLDITDPLLAARRARRTLEILSECGGQLPGDVDFYMLSAANYRILGRPADAEAMYAKGLQYDRRPELYFGLATAQLDQGKTADAVANFVYAVTFNRDLLGDIPDEVRSQVVALLTRNSPWLGIASQ